MSNIQEKYFQLKAFISEKYFGPTYMTMTVKTVAIVAIALVAGAVMFPGCITQEEAESANMPIVLFTDFGTESYWVPHLKGIIYSVNP